MYEIRHRIVDGQYPKDLTLQTREIAARTERRLKNLTLTIIGSWIALFCLTMFILFFTRFWVDADCMQRFLFTICMLSILLLPQASLIAFFPTYQEDSLLKLQIRRNDEIKLTIVFTMNKSGEQYSEIRIVLPFIIDEIIWRPKSVTTTLEYYNNKYTVIFMLVP